MPNTGESPSEERESSLLQILEENPQEKYYLSEKACLGILRRAEKRGKKLPEKLKAALEYQAWGGTARPKTMRVRCGCEGGGKGPLVQEDKSGTLSCHNDQTVFVPVTKEVIALENHSQDCRVGIAKDNICPTLTGKMGTGGNNVPLLMESRSTAYGICSMDSNAMKSGNPDSGFYEAKTSRTLDCKGGNPTCNQGGIVIVDEKRPAYAIQGNMIGREEQNGSNGKGISEDVSFTLTARDRHAVAYAIGRDYVTVHEDVAQTLTAELFPGSVAQPYSIGNGQANSLSLDEKAGTLNCMHDQQAVMVPNEDVEYVVRRFTPLECGRLQGFPDDWTDGIGDEEPGKKEVQFWQDAWAEWWALIGRAKGVKRPKDEKAVRRWMKNPASDTELYKMWGNGIALPCVLYVFEGIALQINSGDSHKEQ